MQQIKFSIVCVCVLVEVAKQRSIQFMLCIAMNFDRKKVKNSMKYEKKCVDIKSNVERNDPNSNDYMFNCEVGDSLRF